MYSFRGGPADAKECFNYFGEYFENGYFMGGSTVGFTVPFTPWVAVVDLSDAKLLHRDTKDKRDTTAAEIISLVEKANR